MTDANDLLIGDDNPIGNPGFGDSRWLRSSEPQRVYDVNGWLGSPDPFAPDARPPIGFTHWSHLSWPATAENGWRVCVDLANVAAYDVDAGIYDPYDPGGVDIRNAGFTLGLSTADAFRQGATDYGAIGYPVALQTPYEQWLPGVVPNPYLGTDDFLRRRNSWFGSPSSHFFALYRAQDAMPNFIKLNELGPRREAFQPGTNRNVVERTLADADGDGFTDSFWFLLPGVSEDGVRQVAAVSVVDNASMVDVNVASRFDRWSTAGQTPADVALTSRLVQPGFQATGFASGASVYDPADTWTGLFSDPQNTTPGDVWNLGFNYDFTYGYRPSPGTAQPLTLRTSFDPYRFGDSTVASSSWLRQTGVLNQDQSQVGFDALEAPFGSLLVALNQSSPGRAAFDRRRYFQRRLNDGGLFVRKADADGPLAVDDWGVGNVPPRGFSDADELELRMFSSSNYGPVISTLERTINLPWNRNANFLRSTLARSESVENYLAYFDGDVNSGWPPNPNTGGIPIGDQLTNGQLLKDARHRMTTYSATRNDLRPLHLRPTALYDPTFDYAFGRLRANPGDLPNDLANREAYEVRKRKIDLRRPVDAPLTAFEARLYKFFPGPFNAAGALTAQEFQEVGPSVWPNGVSSPFGARVELDRSYRFRLELQRTIADATSALLRDGDGNSLTQSYLGSNYESAADNQLDFLRTQLLAASWSANVDTFRDNRARPAVAYDYASQVGPPTQGTTQQIDAPIFPDWAPRIDQADDQFLPQDLKNLSFPGLEKQPFIMEAFFSLVYPPSRISVQIADELNDENGDYAKFLEFEGQEDEMPSAGEDRIPYGFRDSGDRWVDRESEPAIVFAIQLANPFEAPVPLHDLFLRIGDSNSITRCLNLAKLASPHPRALAGDPGGDDNNTPRTGPYYFPSELYLGPTLPDAPRTAIVFGVIPPNGIDLDGTGADSFADEFGIAYGEFHSKWMDFLDLEPGALYGWDEDLPLAAHQTMVFDASPRTYIRTSPASAGTEFKPLIPPLLGLEPDRWFDDPEQSVELLKFVSNPLTYDETAPFSAGGYLYAIDRLDNATTGAKIEFTDQMKRLVEDEFAPSMEQAYSFEFPGPENRREWGGIRLKGDDLLVSWVRAARAWGWDVNRNGAYDLSEISPRFIYSEIPSDDWIRDEVSGEVVGGGTVQVNAVTIDLDDDPDGTPSTAPWMSRAYLSPLALKPTNSVDGYPFEFVGLRAKPVHLTTSTALVPTTVQAGAIPKVDYDAGFPVLVNGDTRTQPSAAGWPGRPARDYRWVLMDKGQDPEETLPGNRDGQLQGQYGRIWLEQDQWAYPLQMLQKDADFEQVGELANVFLWGHALRHRPGITSPQSLGGTPLLPTVFTFGEIMNSQLAEDPLPVVRSDIQQLGLPDSSRIRTNRFYADPGNIAAPAGLATGGFRPYTQVVEAATVAEPWTPRLPAGLSLFDALVCDGSGANYVPNFRNPSGSADPTLDVVERLVLEEQRFGNAAGFTGRGTRGLINVNTAPVEVLRSLPHAGRLVYNDRIWTGTTEDPFAGPNPYVLPRARQIAGDVDDAGRPKGLAARNPQWVRVPEVMVRYREGAGLFDNGAIRAVRQEQLSSWPLRSTWLPAYDDRGTYNYGLAESEGAPQMAPWIRDNVSYPDPNIGGTDPDFGVPGLFPGMRRGAGIVSLGELMLMSRGGVPIQNVEVSKSGVQAGSIEAAARDPYSYQSLPAFGGTGSNGSSTVFYDPGALDTTVQARLGLGWRPADPTNDLSDQADARLSTDRCNVRWQQVKGPQNPAVTIPDTVAGDAEEANLLFAGLSNLVSVRSDTFTVHLKIRSFKQNPVNGVWNATDPEFIVDESRYVFVVDRSRCDRPGDEPEIRLLSKLPN
ncbi:MAG: hypothetical protein VX672_07640 [Planctomycetota bacterium]|nr:hypothetical protein [Planctomycetota bacterium]